MLEETPPSGDTDIVSPALTAATIGCDTSSKEAPIAWKSSVARNFKRLPAELRLKIWRCAAEPRVVILDDVLRRPKAYPLPSVAQVSREARHESRDGYEAVGPCRSSHVHFGRDIFVCDASITETTSNQPLEALATRVERLAFWDCFPDDNRVELPYFYSTYLAASQAAAASAARISSGSTPSSSTAGIGVPSPGPRLPAVDFDKLWFPNLRDLWIVKVGGVDRAWLIDADLGEQEAAAAAAPPKNTSATGRATLHYPVPLSQHPHCHRTARKFRYWVQHNVVEMAPLSLDDPDTRLVLREGRCGKPDCQELNRGRSVLLSKVTFMEGEYRPSQGWLRIAPWDGCDTTSADADGSRITDRDAVGEGSGIKSKDGSRDSMRWVVVERILTFSLRWESSDDTDEGSRRHIGSRTHG
ncbi:hypothetical protein ISF_01180 [Cordyceps fumosorosea ARSEF 2679]|uniref:2EXR domain-containing protein n=1 Tax=Cordyceps fumosorosea (strain ARSEF 2679) TaxID=1081104 RepID=A0A168D2Z8_CORFA|nr:hypothetical protein ISF_01180 [Cordyceps fumosorosea ARSEF 2679]OAA72107.1 hypothetical protein ISF_01180 [Cordyceps fumosorosea ARSEF 2679]